MLIEAWLSPTFQYTSRRSLSPPQVLSEGTDQHDHKWAVTNVVSENANSQTTYKRIGALQVTTAPTTYPR